MVGPPLAGQIRACFPSRDARPACSGAAGLGQHAKAWCVAGNRVMLVSYFTLCAQGTGLNQRPENPVREQPGEGASQACPCLEPVVRQENSLGDRPDGERQTLEPGQPVAAGPAVL